MWTVFAIVLTIGISIEIARRVVPSANEYAKQFQKELEITITRPQTSFEKDWESMTEGTTER